MKLFKNVMVYTFLCALGVLSVVQGMHYVPSLEEVSYPVTEDLLVYGAKLPEQQTFEADAKQKKLAAGVEEMLQDLRSLPKLTQAGQVGTADQRKMALNDVRLTVRSIIALIDRLEKGRYETNSLLKKLEDFVVNLDKGTQGNQAFVDAVLTELRELADNYQVRAANPKYAIQYNDPYAVALAKAGRARKAGVSYEAMLMPSNAPAEKISGKLNSLIRMRLK